MQFRRSELERVLFNDKPDGSPFSLCEPPRTLR